MKNKIYLHKKYLLKIIYKAIKIFSIKPSLVDINLKEDEIKLFVSMFMVNFMIF